VVSNVCVGPEPDGYNKASQLRVKPQQSKLVNREWRQDVNHSVLENGQTTQAANRSTHYVRID
jgi:hypothetical protein